VDAPRHFFVDGKTVDQFPLERFVRPAVTLALELEGPVAVTAEDLEPARAHVQEGDFLFLSFGYAGRFGTPAYYDHPYLTRDAAEFLLSLGVSGLGTDTLTPDQPTEHREQGFDFPVHRTLLAEDVLIYENLGPGLRTIAGRRVLVSAVPLPLAGDGSLVAPYAVMSGDGRMP
jgi:kynurenine formamidase